MINNNLIFDIGMHIGRDTEFYLKKGFNVIAVEANPILVEKGKEKFKNEIESGQLVIIDKAISDSFGTIDFYIFEEKDDWGTINPIWNRDMGTTLKTVKTITVETTTLDSLIVKYGTPYYLKIDIEGADVLCLKSLLKIQERPTYVSAELLTPRNVGVCDDSLEILCYLKALGYNKFSISDQSKNEFVKCPQPSLEGNYINYSFDGTCSGLFGEELPGPWLSIDKVSMYYLNYFHNTNRILEEDNAFNPTSWEWFDVHAKIN